MILLHHFGRRLAGPRVLSVLPTATSTGPWVGPDVERRAAALGKRGCAEQIRGLSTIVKKETPRSSASAMINEAIRPAKGMVRLIEQTGVNKGIVPIGLALETAKKAGLDLVQITESPKSEEEKAEFVPVCKILDFSKFSYELKKKEAEKRAQIREQEKAASYKELKFGTSIGEHDLSHKLKQGKGFLEKGYQLRAVYLFRRSLVIKPDERQAKAFELLRASEEYFAGAGREIAEHRKVLPYGIRVTFVPTKPSK